MSYRDKRIASDVNAPDPLMCGAIGCPNRWSVDAGQGRLCSAHAWAERHDWPAITADEKRAETDRVLARSRAKPPEPARPYTKAEKMELLKLAAGLGQPKDPKAWAYDLQAREQAGEVLTLAQRDMWRAALHKPTNAPATEPPDDAA